MAEQELSFEQSLDATMDETAESLAGEQTKDSVQGATAADSISAPAGSSPANAAESAPAPGTPAPQDDYPKGWKRELAEKWKTLDPEIRAEAIRREQDMERGVIPLKERAAIAERLNKTVEPFMDTIRQVASGDPLIAVEHLLKADQALRSGTPEQKWQYLQYLAQQYGIQDPQQLASRDPYIAQLEAKVNQIESQMTDTQRRAVTELRENTSREVQSFAADTTKHPYFDECSEDIVKLINAGYNLNDAYERSVWSNPITRQKELVRIQDESGKAVAERAKQEAAAARKARGTNVGGRESEKVSQDPLGSWDDTMKETLAEIKSRT